MKRFLILAALLASSAAHADGIEQMANCDALTGQKGVCVFNNTKQPIRAVTCDNSGWTGPKEYGMMIPRGSIPPGHMTIINFDDHADCARGLHVMTNDGRRHDFSGQDTKTATVLSIDGDW